MCAQCGTCVCLCVLVCARCVRVCVCVYVCVLTDPAAGAVVVQVHEGAAVPDALLSRVHEVARELGSVAHVVRAAAPVELPDRVARLKRGCDARFKDFLEPQTPCDAPLQVLGCSGARCACTGAVHPGVVPEMCCACATCGTLRGSSAHGKGESDCCTPNQWTAGIEADLKDQG